MAFTTVIHPIPDGTKQPVDRVNTDQDVARIKLMRPEEGNASPDASIQSILTQLQTLTTAIGTLLTDVQLRATPVDVFTQASTAAQSTGGFTYVRLTDGVRPLDAPQNGPATALPGLLGENTIIAAPAADNHIQIYSMEILQNGGADTTVLLRDGAGGTAKYGIRLGIGTDARPIGVNINFGRGWALTGGATPSGLVVDLSVANNVRINVLDYSIVDETP